MLPQLAGLSLLRHFALSKYKTQFELVPDNAPSQHIHVLSCGRVELRSKAYTALPSGTKHLNQLLSCFFDFWGKVNLQSLPY